MGHAPPPDYLTSHDTARSTGELMRTQEWGGEKAVRGRPGLLSGPRYVLSQRWTSDGDKSANVADIKAETSHCSQPRSERNYTTSVTKQQASMMAAGHAAGSAL